MVQLYNGPRQNLKYFPMLTELNIRALSFNSQKSTYNFFLSFCLFRAAPTANGGSQAWGPIWAVVASLRQGHSNAGSLTHWSRPGIEPTSSWMLVGFVNHWAMTGISKVHIYLYSQPSISIAPHLVDSTSCSSHIVVCIYWKIWCSRLRIQCCQYSGLGHCCGMGLIPGLRTSFMSWAQPKKHPHPRILIAKELLQISKKSTKQ